MWRGMREAVKAFSVQRDCPITAEEIGGLRASVGWDRDAGNWDRVLENAYMHLTIHDDGRLIGYANVISDGASNAFISDLMIHPDYQRRGLGRNIVRHAVGELKAAGIRGVHTTFVPELEPFYRSCGFYIFKGGIIDTDLER